MICCYVEMTLVLFFCFIIPVFSLYSCLYNIFWLSVTGELFNQISPPKMCPKFSVEMSMSRMCISAGFEPTISEYKRQHNDASDRTNAGTGTSDNSSSKFNAALLFYF